MKKTYSCGAMFLIGGLPTILAQVETNKVCLIDLKTGNRWDKPKKVKDSDSMTMSEVKSLSGRKTVPLNGGMNG